jgi:hypothetical protein
MEDPSAQTEEQRKAAALARGYSRERADQFLVKVRRNALALLEFVYLLTVSRCSEASEGVSELIDEFVWDLTYWEQANVFYALQDDLAACALKTARYYTSVARQLEDRRLTPLE